MRKFNWVMLLLFVVGMTTFQSCEKEETTPPTPLPNPISCFSSNVSVTYPNEDVTFLNCSQNAESYSWDFGDGRTSIEASPEHAFSSIGTYRVALTVTNTSGATNISYKDIEVKNPPSRVTIHEIKIVKWPETNNGTPMGCRFNGRPVS